MRRVDAALALLLAVIAATTLTPVSGENRLVLVPGRDIAHSVTRPLELLVVIANVAVFIPVGLLLALRGVSRARALLAAAAFSASIEIVQLAVPGRTTSVDDVLLNTAGAAIGVALAGWLRARRRGR